MYTVLTTTKHKRDETIPYKILWELTFLLLPALIPILLTQGWFLLSGYTFGALIRFFSENISELLLIVFSTSFNTMGIQFRKGLRRKTASNFLVWIIPVLSAMCSLSIYVIFKILPIFAQDHNTFPFLTIVLITLSANTIIYIVSQCMELREGANIEVQKSAE